MIFLLDDPLSETSHSKDMLGILAEHTTQPVQHIPLLPNLPMFDLVALVLSLAPKCLGTDVVLCPWSVPGNLALDNAFTELSKVCAVVAAAGHNGGYVNEVSPARAHGVTAVGLLNKRGEISASATRTKGKPIQWVVGTNYLLNGRFISGSSVSAAVYAACLAEALACGFFVGCQQKLNAYHQKCWEEVSGTPSSVNPPTLVPTITLGNSHGQN